MALCSLYSCKLTCSLTVFVSNLCLCLPLSYKQNQQQKIFNVFLKPEMMNSLPHDGVADAREFLFQWFSARVNTVLNIHRLLGFSLIHMILWWSWDSPQDSTFQGHIQGQSILWPHSPTNNPWIVSLSLWSLPVLFSGFSVSTFPRWRISHWFMIHTTEHMFSPPFTWIHHRMWGLRSASPLAVLWGHCPSPTWRLPPLVSSGYTCPLTDASSVLSRWGKTPPGWPVTHTGWSGEWSPPARGLARDAPLSARGQNVTVCAVCMAIAFLSTTRRYFTQRCSHLCLIYVVRDALSKYSTPFILLYSSIVKENMNTSYLLFIYMMMHMMQYKKQILHLRRYRLERGELVSKVK